MRLGKCWIKNFGSYKSLEFDFQNLGLALIFGPTGAGKSTLADIASWILYGATAKNVSVNDVKSWTTLGEPTEGDLEVIMPTHTIRVTRIRGDAKQNDLYWLDSRFQAQPQRGANIQDTQKLISAMLGANAELYNMAAVFNEFSPIGNFYTLKAKDRRAIFENIAPLTLPTMLVEKLTEEKKKIKKERADYHTALTKLQSRHEQIEDSLADAKTRSNTWLEEHESEGHMLEKKLKFFDKDKQAKVKAIEDKSYRFDADKHKKEQDLIDKIDILSQAIKPAETMAFFVREAEKALAKMPLCPTCRRTNLTSKELEEAKEAARANASNVEKFNELGRRLREVQTVKNPYKEQLEEAKAEINHYEDALKNHNKQLNPFLAQIAGLEAQKKDLHKKVGDAAEMVAHSNVYMASLDQLHDLSFELRAKLLEQSIKQVEYSTNKVLEKHFDAAFRVMFAPDGSDGLDVQVFKNGYTCSYTQLSKGQRQLLKLSFVVSIMSATANNAGIHFSLLSFDEALDGLDADLKVKAYDLFLELSKSHESILVIDHSAELQNMFETKYEVTMVGDESQVSRV